MSSNKVLAAELWAMIAVQTIGAVDIPKPGGKGQTRKLPAPRNYAAAFVLWAILGLVAQLGPRQARIASALGGSAVLVALLVGVAGPGARKPGESIGGRLVDFLNRVSGIFAPPAGAEQSDSGVEPEQPTEVYA